jgi:hypothetical protein
MTMLPLEKAQRPDVKSIEAPTLTTLNINITIIFGKTYYCLQLRALRLFDVQIIALNLLQAISIDSGK